MKRLISTAMVLSLLGGAAAEAGSGAVMAAQREQRQDGPRGDRGGDRGGGRGGDSAGQPGGRPDGERPSGWQGGDQPRGDRSGGGRVDWGGARPDWNGGGRPAPQAPTPPPAPQAPPVFQAPQPSGQPGRDRGDRGGRPDQGRPDQGRGDQGRPGGGDNRGGQDWNRGGPSRPDQGRPDQGRGDQGRPGGGDDRGGQDWNRGGPSRPDQGRPDQGRGDQGRPGGGDNRGGQDWNRGPQDRNGGWDRGRDDRGRDGRGRDDRGGYDRGGYDRNRPGYQYRDRDNGRSHYDQRRYRPSFQGSQRFRIGPYRAPRGWYVRSWSYGDYLPGGWYSSAYYLDWYRYGLPQPPIGCEWVRVGDNAILVDVWSGQVLSVYYNLFW